MKRKLTKILSLTLVVVLLLGLTMPMASASDPVEDFVTRLYTLVLDRPADPDGIAGWVEVLKNGTADGANTAWGFFFSDEMKARPLTPAEYVTILYETLMDRVPAQVELDAWVAQMDKGYPKEDIFHGFAMSDEFEYICNKYGINRGVYTPPPGGPIRPFVTRLYTLVLNRPADPEGIDGWTEALVSGRADGATVAHGFFFSDEFLNRPLSETEIVNILYQTLMDRTPAQSELNSWVARMAEVPFEHIFHGFVMSEEFAFICAQFGIIRGVYEPPPFDPWAPETGPGTVIGAITPGTVILNRDGVIITFENQYTAYYGEPFIEFTVENTTGRILEVWIDSWETSIVNGHSIELGGGGTVFPGTKGTLTMWIHDEEVANLGITSINELTISFRAFDIIDGSILFRHGTRMTFNPSPPTERPELPYVPITPPAGTDIGKVIVDQNGVRVTYLGATIDEFDNVQLNIRIDNTTGRTIDIWSMGITTGGVTVIGGFYEEIPPASSRNSSITIEFWSLLTNGIATVDEVQLIIYFEDITDWNWASLTHTALRP